MALKLDRPDLIARLGVIQVSSQEGGHADPAVEIQGVSIHDLIPDEWRGELYGHMLSDEFQTRFPVLLLIQPMLAAPPEDCQHVALEPAPEHLSRWDRLCDIVRRVFDGLASDEGTAGWRADYTEAGRLCQLTLTWSLKRPRG